MFSSCLIPIPCAYSIAPIAGHQNVTALFPSFCTVCLCPLAALPPCPRSFDDPSPQARGRYHPSMQPEISMEQWRKGRQVSTRALPAPHPRLSQTQPCIRVPASVPDGEIQGDRHDRWLAVWLDLEVGLSPRSWYRWPSAIRAAR